MLRHGLESRRWSDQQELMLWLDSLNDIEQCVATGLRESLDSQNWRMFDKYVLAATRRPSRAYTSTLCNALAIRSEKLNAEDVVDVLGDIGDPESVGCLEQALEWEPPWDEYRQLGVKIVWALAGINNEEAHVILKRAAAESGSTEIRRAASQKLEALGIRSA
jgi:hypothetical protein